MKPFNSKRLSYFEDLENDPEVSGAIGKTVKEEEDKESGMFWANSNNYDDYTPEVLKKLRKLYDEKKLPAWPFKNEESIMWLRAERAGSGSQDIARFNDLPAQIRSSGELVWWSGGGMKRSDGPAIIYKNGDQFWSKDGSNFILGKKNGKYFHRINQNTVPLSPEQFNEYLKIEFPNARPEFYAAV